MKKFFKLFAVALVAGCMFTACGEKENNGENNGGNNGGNGGNGGNIPSANAGQVAVTFGTDSWTAEGQNAMGIYVTSYDMLGVIGATDAHEADCFIMGSATGTYTDTYDVNNMGWTNGKMSYIEYYDESSLVDQSGNYYGDFWATSATVNVTAFDATALTVSLNCEAEMFSALEVLVNGNPFASCTKKNMGINANNISVSQQ